MKICLDIVRCQTMEAQIYLFSTSTEDINIKSHFCIKLQTMLKPKS